MSMKGLCPDMCRGITGGFLCDQREFFRRQGLGRPEQSVVHRLGRLRPLGGHQLRGALQIRPEQLPQHSGNQIQECAGVQLFVRYSCAHQTFMHTLKHALKRMQHSLCLQHWAGVGRSLSTSAWLVARQKA